MSTWVVSPCKRSRDDELKAMLATLGHDPAHVVVVTTLPDPIEGDDVMGYADHVVVFERPGMLFGEWFNTGFSYIDGVRSDDEPFEILCIGSSLVGAWDTVARLRNALRSHNLAMVGPDVFGRLSDGQVETHQNDQRTVHNRILPNCFMFAGELRLRFDPQFRWWWGDDDMDMQARQFGPVGNVGGCRVLMTHPDGHYLSEEQATWAAEDRLKFAAKWNLPLEQLWGG